MLESLATVVELSRNELVLSVFAIFLAGLVRGFSGFALSALIMASLAVVMPPVSLIPVCYVLEAIASILMFRGGQRLADWTVVWGLAIGSAIGVPIGLYATIHVSPDVSRLIALILVLSLAALQFFRTTPAFLGTRPGLYVTGLLAGVVTGLASVGGMVVALYVLAHKAAPDRMRASLVMFLFVGIFTSGAWLVSVGILDRLALTRGFVFSPFVASGVILGSSLFRPFLQGFYRSFCLILLMGLALAGLVRLVIAS